ncbi:MAG: hypothetical protein KM310_00510 [Clostridiales bacterium]|nr:hypothetical protein [Clostridiales bacterium]
MREQHIQLVARALKQLADEFRNLIADTYPATPLPRFRRFELARGIAWPRDTDTQSKFDLYYLEVGGRIFTITSSDLAEKIVDLSEGKPRHILRSIRRIEAAAEWCRARAEGRKRMAEEILRQQKRAKEVLDAEIALMVLAKDNPKERGGYPDVDGGDGNGA